MDRSKIYSARKIIETAAAQAPAGHKFFLFSGGKDSLIACHLAKQTIGLVDGFCELSLLPKKTEDEVKFLAEHYGYNIQFSNKLNPVAFSEIWDSQICNPRWRPSTLDKERHWKAIPEFAKKTNAGLMLFGRRKQENTIPSPIYFKKSLKAIQVHPILDWTLQDVWDYINENKLPFPSCYTDGSKHLFTWVSLAHEVFKRTGSRKETYDLIWKYAPEYLIIRAKQEEFANSYINTKK
jgi:3'-phosphoadenosine 5'-phosphosulfate sulfotransferase (PAPS reductase)/FAD synthetase